MDVNGVYKLITGGQHAVRDGTNLETVTQGKFNGIQSNYDVRMK